MVNLMLGNCLDKLKELEDNSVDSIVTDPPYEIGFMGKKWDNSGIAYNVDMWKECLRVLKPGGHLLSFGGTRTYHRMTTAIEDAGFEIRDMIEWVYGSGFPKSFNIGKGIDKKEGNERIVVSKDKSGKSSRAFQSMENTTAGVYEIDKGTSKFEGFGSALKPAHEPICLARKKISEKTIVDNVLKWGTGGINIDKSRIGFQSDSDKDNFNYCSEGINRQKSSNAIFDNNKIIGNHNLNDSRQEGRFPANFIHDCSDEVKDCFPESKGMSGGGQGNGWHKKHTEYDKTSQIRNDSGSAARYFKSIIYQAKSSKKEKNEGLDDFEDKIKTTMATKGGTSNIPSKGMERFETITKNNHPTVKPINLMEYLINMITPTQGIVLDPFTGSGSTGVAAVKNNFSFIGIEMDEDYIKIAEARINHFKK